MKVPLEFLRFFILSYETIIFLGGCCLCIYFKDWNSKFLMNFSNENSFIAYIAVIPTALSGWSILYTRKLLFPEKDLTNIMQMWPDYHILKIGIYAALIWAFIFCTAGWAAWALWLSGAKEISAFIIATSLTGSAISASSVLFAEISINERFNAAKSRLKN